MLTRETIAPIVATLAARGNSGMSVFTDVIDSIDRITLSPEFLSMEDLTKLWSALQARYRLSATYRASVLMRALDDATISAKRTRNG